MSAYSRIVGIVEFWGLTFIQWLTWMLEDVVSKCMRCHFSFSLIR